MKKAAKRAAGLHRASLTKLHDLDAALELMYYGWRGMTLAADQYLATLGLSRLQRLPRRRVSRVQRPHHSGRGHSHAHPPRGNRRTRICGKDVGYENDHDGRACASPDRILYVVARQPDISIGALIEILGISKQAVNRPLNLLLQRKLLTSKRSPEQHRSKLLRLTEAGKRIEQRASDYERKVLREAFDRVGPPGAAAWMAVMGVIADNN